MEWASVVFSAGRYALSPFWESDYHYGTEPGVPVDPPRTGDHHQETL